jgi:5-oxoprolinase (ATP-hydrolysing)
VADALGMKRVLLHPSPACCRPIGMGLADVRALREGAVEPPLDDAIADDGRPARRSGADAAAEVAARASTPPRSRCASMHLRYHGTDSPGRAFADADGHARGLRGAQHRQRSASHGRNRGLIVEAVSVEAVGGTAVPSGSGLFETASGSPSHRP